VSFFRDKPANPDKIRIYKVLLIIQTANNYHLIVLISLINFSLNKALKIVFRQLQKHHLKIANINQ